jgi:hypothetical protein
MAFPRAFDCARRSIGPRPSRPCRWISNTNTADRRCLSLPLAFTKYFVRLCDAALRCRSAPRTWPTHWKCTGLVQATGP